MADCNVKDCPNEGHRQICPVDQRYHHHGGIHPPASWEARMLGGWPVFVCNDHITEMETEVNDARAARIASMRQSSRYSKLPL